MRPIHGLLILAAFLLPGCTDSLGLSGGCSSEEHSVRLAHGPPDRTASGEQSEIWFYDDERLSYEFSWASGSCRVTQSSFSRSPVPEAG
ncbi:MAG TPA: hypothetical protein VFL93_07355 [Longimicrobiaceae bacterium]|nr:hypothetical protein [Longimicrobiaceae bacterium]